jgi:hypothetical protein
MKSSAGQDGKPREYSGRLGGCASRLGVSRPSHETDIRPTIIRPRQSRPQAGRGRDEGEGLEMRSFANDRRLIQLKSAGLVKHDALANIKPSFENDTNIVAVPPQQSAFSNCVKIVECYVKVYRKQA